MLQTVRRGLGCGVAAALLLAAPVVQLQELVAPFVETPQEDVRVMLDVADVGPGDYVVDLGAGDGRIVIEAARRGALGHGVELQQDLVEKSRRRAREAGVAERVLFEQGDIFEADFHRATVVTLYLGPEPTLEMRPLLLEQLRPGTVVLSNNFHMGAWRSDEFHELERSSGGVHLWIVPASVEGTWRLQVEGRRQPLELEIRQHFQHIRPELRWNDRRLAVEEATLRGGRISFLAREDDSERLYGFSGRVDDDRMRGYVQVDDEDGERRLNWVARQVAPDG